MTLTHFSLFSGIGGIDLAAEWAGFTTVGQCEWADYPTKVLEKHWPDVPRWRDIRSVTAESFFDRTGLRTVDLVSGGFPCQPFSTAGMRKGKDDDRYLWPEMLRVISELQPNWVLGENVAGIVSMALEQVWLDLENQGYEVQPILIPACGVNAPHRRYRCFILAHSEGGNAIGNAGELQVENELQKAKRQKKRLTEPSGASSIQGHVSHTDSPRLQGCSKAGNTGSKGEEFFQQSTGCRDGERWWAVEPGVGRVAHGIPSRVDRIKCLGNAVVPQQVYPILAAIAELEVT